MKKLNAEQRISPAWLALKAELEDRLHELRLKNDSLAMDRTERLRGHIQALKEIIDLGNESPEITVPEQF